VSAADWLTPEDVAAYLDLPTADDDNLLLSTAAVKAAVERRRSDLWKGDPPAFAPGDDVKAGAVIWSGLMFQTRNAPSGFAGYGDDRILTSRNDLVKQDRSIFFKVSYAIQR